MKPSYASLCSVSNVVFFSGKVTNIPAVPQPSSTCQWFRLLTVCCQNFTHQPVVFCVVRSTLISLGLAKRAVSLFSSRAAALVSRQPRSQGSPPTRPTERERTGRREPWERGWILACRGFVAQRSRARALPLLNLKKQRDCSQSRMFEL